MKYKRGNPITKVLYVMLLLVLMMLLLYYLGMIHNSSVIEITEVILGFLLTHIIQLKIVSVYFGARMEELDLDEFGMVRDLIRSTIFGEINRDYIARKNKIKYYSHTKN